MCIFMYICTFVGPNGSKILLNIISFMVHMSVLACLNPLTPKLDMLFRTAELFPKYTIVCASDVCY